MSVYYRPARQKCLPVLAPAQAFVRAGAGRRGKCGIGARGMCAPGDAFLLRRLSSVYACHFRSVAAFAFDTRPALRFCCGGCLRYTPAISGSLRRLPSIRARRCVSVAAVVFGIRLPFQVCCGVCLRYALGDAFLLRRLSSVYACHFRSVAAFAFDTRPAMRFCRCVLPSVHACCLPHGDKQDGLRNPPFLFCAGRDRY